MPVQVITNTGQMKGVVPTTFRKSTTKTVVSTVTATDLLNGEITLPANALSATGIARISLWGDWLNNQGGAAPPRLQLVLGGTTLIDTGACGGNVSNPSADRGGWTASAIIAATNATNVQSVSWENRFMSGALTYATPSVNVARFTTGNGTYQVVPSHANANNSDGSLFVAVGHNTGAKDMTASQSLVINTINGQGTASYEIKLFGALVEII